MSHRSRTGLIVLVLVFILPILAACSPKPAPNPLMELESWDLVFISPSNGWGVADAYAAMIEEDTGIPVVVHDLSTGTLSAGMVLDGMDGGGNQLSLKSLPDLLPEAEVVVISMLDPRDSVDPNAEGNWNCLGPTNFVDECPAEPLKPFYDDMSTIFTRVFEARDGQPTIVRAFDIYSFPGDWKRDGVYEDCLTCWRDMMLAGFYEVTASYNIPTAHVFEAWSAPDFSSNPDEGLFSDGTHPNEAGAKAEAQLLRELGYEPTEP